MMQTLLPGSTDFVREAYAGDDESIRSVHKAENGFVIEVETRSMMLPGLETEEDQVRPGMNVGGPGGSGNILLQATDVSEPREKALSPSPCFWLDWHKDGPSQRGR